MLFRSPLHNLTGTYPDDIYSPMAAQYYGHYGNGSALDRHSVGIMQQVKDKPDALVTMYRAVPKEPTIAEQIATLEKQKSAYMARGRIPAEAADFSNPSAWYDYASSQLEKLKAMPQQAAEKLRINDGDWVTLNRGYAKEHGESRLDGKYQILSQRVPARKLFTDGNSIHEFGYDESGKAAAGLLALIAGGTGAGLAGYDWLNKP